MTSTPILLKLLWDILNKEGYFNTSSMSDFNAYITEAPMGYLK